MPINFHAHLNKSDFEKECAKVEALMEKEGFSQTKKIFFLKLLDYLKKATAGRWLKFKPTNERYAVVNNIFNGYCKPDGSQLDDLLYSQYVLNKLDLIPDSANSDLKISKDDVCLYDLASGVRNTLIQPMVKARQATADKWYGAAVLMGIGWFILQPWAGENLIVSPHHLLALGTLLCLGKGSGDHTALAIADVQSQLTAARTIPLVGYRENNLYAASSAANPTVAAANPAPLPQPSAPGF